MGEVLSFEARQKPLDIMQLRRFHFDEKTLLGIFSRVPSDDELRTIDDHMKAFARTQGAKLWGTGRYAQMSLGLDFTFDEPPSEHSISIYQQSLKRMFAVDSTRERND